LFEAQFRYNAPRAYAALVLLSLTGVAIFAATSLISYLALRRWHESATPRET
jgi:NitT/TauT family transport system permease protein